MDREKADSFVGKKLSLRGYNALRQDDATETMFEYANQKVTITKSCFNEETFIGFLAKETGAFCWGRDSIIIPNDKKEESIEDLLSENL